MQTFVADHPLVAHKLTTLRDIRTPTHEFRRLADELVTLLAYEATRHLPVETVAIETPVTSAEGVRLTDPAPMIVPVLRAGIGMLDGMMRLLPGAAVGFIGLARDEATLVATTYAARLPADLTGREIFVLDPMLATGGTLETVIQLVIGRGAAGVTAVGLLAAPEGLQRLDRAFPEKETPVPVRIVTAALDDRLNEQGYIVPGLGDAGDRLFGAV
jgi:uracil phosphoribosyltransferase